MTRFTLTSGETLVGTPNYVTATHVEVRTDRTEIGRYRWIRRDQITRRKPVRKAD